MDAFMKMDIFFFVTTTVVIILGLLMSVCMYYLMHVLRDIRDITATVKKEAESVVEDMHEVRKDIKDGIASAKRYTTHAVAGASIVKGLSALFESLTEAKTRTRRRTKRASGDDE
jgi:hypothetical protein